MDLPRRPVRPQGPPDRRRQPTTSAPRRLPEGARHRAAAARRPRLGLARISATLHDFAGAMVAATTVLEDDPYADGALAIIFDAALELGDLDNAERALTLLDERIDSPAVTVRQARLAFIDGDTAGAQTLAAQAVDAGRRPRPSCRRAVAFYQYARGRVRAARRRSRRRSSRLRGRARCAARLRPGGLRPGPRRVRARRHRRRDRASSRAPSPPCRGRTCVALPGRPVRADRQTRPRRTTQYDTVEFIAGLSAATAATRSTTASTSLFLADHARDAGDGRRAGRRPSSSSARTSTATTRSPGRSTPPAAMRGAASTSTRRWRSARPTRSCSSTPG